MTKTKNLTISAMFVALCIVLPMAFHSVANAGQVFLPMHIPVLLCGMICGWPYGLACGVLGPLLSSLMTGMPPMAILPGMMFELAAYGFVTGLLSRKINTGNKILDLYIPLVCAMLLGRLLLGILNALIFRAGSYTLDIWLTAAFVTSLPGIIIQLIIVPAIVFMLRKARLITYPV
jgi:thiamine transporter ThiT